MYRIIDEKEDLQEQKEFAGRITPEMLGLSPTNDFAQFAQQKIIDENPEKSKEWVERGPIGVMEAGERFADEFHGSYGNIDDNAGLNYFDNKQKNSRIFQNRSKTVDERIEKSKEERDARKKRINDGTASVFDKITNTLEKIGERQTEHRLEYVKKNEEEQKPHQDDARYRYKPYGVDRAGNVLYSQTDLSKKIGFHEALVESVESGEALPFVSGLITGADASKYRNIAERIRKNEAIRQDELDFLNRYTERRQEEYLRGYSIGGQIGASLMPSMLAFAGEIAAGGAVLSGLGLAGKGVMAGASIGDKLVKINKFGKVGEKIAKGIGWLSGEIAEASLQGAVTTGINPFRLYSTFKERRLNDEIKITDRGTVVFSEAKETPAKAFFKSLASVYISFWAESMGGAIGGLFIRPVSKMAGAAGRAGVKQFENVLKRNPQLEKMIKKTTPVLSKAYEKLNNLPIKGKSAEWLKSRVKFDGFLEELGEEVLEDILNITAGTNYEERSLENYVKAVVKNPEEWAVLAGVIALQGGTISIAGNLLGDAMERNGSKEEDIFKVLSTSTEAEKMELIDGLIDNGSIKISEEAFSNVENVAENIEARFIEAGSYEDSEKAKKHSMLFAQILSKLAEKSNRNVDELVEEYLPSVGELKGYVYIDNDGNGYKSSQIESRMNELIEEFNSIPEDYKNSEHVNVLLRDIEILDNLLKDNFKEEEAPRAYELLSRSGENSSSQELGYEYFQDAKNVSNAVDLTNDFEKTPTIDEVKQHINNIIEQGTKFATLSPEWFVDIRGGNRTKGKILNRGNYKGLDRKGKNRHKKYIMSLEKLLSHAEYAGEKENTKKYKKPNVEKYHYFKTNIKIGDKIYEIIFDTEEYKNENPQGAITKTVTSKEHLEDINSITDNETGFNPKTVHLYNVSEIKNSNTNIFYQSAAMHKNDKFGSMKDFVQSVQNNIKEHKNEKRQIKNKKLSVPADVIQHDKKHKLSPDEWTEIEDNIDNIFIAKKTEEKNSFSTNNYKVGIQTQSGNYYALVIGINRYDNLICTAMKTTKNGAIAFVEEIGKKDKRKNPSMMPSSQPTAPISNSANSVVSHSQGSNNIISYIKSELNPNNIFYQSAMVSGINPFQKVDIIDLSSKFPNDSTLSKKDLSKYIQSLINSKPLQSKDKKALFSFIGRSKRVGKRDVFIPDHIAASSKVETQHKGARNTVINNIVDLIKNSVLIDSEPNRNKKVMPNVDNYLRFYVPVKIDNDVYTVRITAENNRSKDIFNILNADVYDVIIDKKMTASTHSPVNKQGSLMKPPSDNSIANSNSNLNPDQITIDEMLKGVAGADGKVYYQSSKKHDEYNYINNQVTGKKIDIEMNEDIKVDKITPQEISSNLPFLISNKPSDNKKSLIKILNLRNGAKIEAVNKNTQEKSIINKETIEKSLSNFYRFDKNYTDKIIILNNIQEIFENSHLILSHSDAKNDTSMKVKRYANIVSIEGRDYLIEIVGKDNGALRIYSINSTDTKNDGNQKRLENSQQLDTVNYSISNIQDFFKTKLIGRYNNDYKSLKSGKSIPKFQEEQQNLFPGNREAKKIHKVKGAYLPAEKFIELYKNADESTIIHETAHWWLDIIVESSKYSEEVASDLREIRKFLKNNGEEFTQHQHEKFARGFEAYIRNGSAKNNKLKRIFEDFKRFLLSIYDNLLQLEFKDDDMPGVQALFDRLLTTENQRIQTAVFDRCNEIDMQIKAIKDKQQKEIDEIDEIVKNNLERNVLSERKKRLVSDFLKKADKASDRLPQSVREFKARYKKVTFEILEAATGYKRQFLANPKNWEKVQDAIDKADDKITVDGGMQPEWREFYSDTGVSYNNDEIDGDFKLAQQAFEVLREGSYNFENAEDAEIGKFFGMFDYLHGKVLSLRGEEKDAAMEALTSLFNNMPALPDGAVEELGKKLKDIQDEYIGQKISEKNAAAAGANISLSIQLMSYVTQKLHGMKAYDPQEKRVVRLSNVDKLYKVLKYATNPQSAKEIIRKINAHAIEQLENKEKFILHREIQKQVRINSKLIKSGTLKKGKFDWRTNTIFRELFELNRMNQEQALKEYEKIVKTQDIISGEMRDKWSDSPVGFDEFDRDFQTLLRRSFLEYKKDRVQNLNLGQTRSLLERILELKFEGRRAKNEQELNEKLNRFSYQNNFIQILRSNAKNPVVMTAARHLLHSGQSLANWETIINTLLGEKAAQEHNLLKDEADVEVYTRDILLPFYEKVKKIYSLKKGGIVSKVLDTDDIQPIIDLFQGFEKEKYTYKQKTFNKNTGKFVETGMELTKGQVITLYAWSLNENLKQRLFMQFGSFQLQEMFEHLSDREKELANAMIETCESMYDAINEVYIKTTGLSLPREQFYFPSKTERILSDMDMLHSYIVASKIPSALKERKICKRIKMDPVSPLSILLPHVQKMSRYIIMSEKLNFYQNLFSSPDFAAVLKEVYGNKDGKELHRLLLNQLQASSFVTQNMGNNMLKDVADSIAKNYITSNIGGSFKVMLGQLTSMVNYAENMPFFEWGAGFAKALANPVGTYKYMMENCKYLQARLAGNTQNDIIASLTNETDKFRSIVNFCTSNVKWGDIIAITLGGKPYVDYLISKGMSKEEAFEKFVEDTLRAQQAGSPSSTSAWQKEQARTPLGRMFWAFRNAEFQYERKVLDSIVKASRGDISKKQMVKTIFIYRVLNPILFTNILQQMSLIALLRAFGDGDDPEEILKKMGINTILALLTCNLSHWGYLGIMGGNFLQSLVLYLSRDKDTKIFGSSVPVLNEFEDIIRKLFLKKNGAQVGDWVDAAAFALNIGVGVPAKKALNMAEGVGDIAEGNVGVGLARVAGWGEYTATEAITGEKPKKKKSINIDRI